mmetsp:Transcript_64804/g.153204  ORF Transcript_64804/g.153204 Transcript_64804/m.153204 type:complete len:232 (-) Transcript_64804:365-1060(-)
MPGLSAHDGCVDGAVVQHLVGLHHPEHGRGVDVVRAKVGDGRYGGVSAVVVFGRGKPVIVVGLDEEKRRVPGAQLPDVHRTRPLASDHCPRGVIGAAHDEVTGDDEGNLGEVLDGGGEIVLLQGRADFQSGELAMVQERLFDVVPQCSVLGRALVELDAECSGTDARQQADVSSEGHARVDGTVVPLEIKVHCDVLEDGEPPIQIAPMEDSAFGVGGYHSSAARENFVHKI